MARADLEFDLAAQRTLPDPERVALRRWMWLYVHGFGAHERPRLLFAWWLAQTGHIGEWWGCGPELTPDLHPWGKLPMAATTGRPPCPGCGGKLAEIVYGLPPWPLPGGCIVGGLVESADDPAYACCRCRRYADDGGAPYCGRADPLDLG